jgi:cytochrome c-type biogenesis protein CcmE
MRNTDRKIRIFTSLESTFADMKTSHILLIILLMAAIGVIISMVFKADTYSDFAEAKNKPGQDLQIIGSHVSDKPSVFDTIGGAHFSFYMKDDKGNTAKVVYRGAKPQDFDKLEQIVVIGQWRDSIFAASSLLLKCPSKYNNAKKPEEFSNREFR